MPQSLQKPLLITVCKPSPTPFSMAPFSGATPKRVHSTNDHLSTSNPHREVYSSRLFWSFGWEWTLGHLYVHLSMSRVGCVLSQQSYSLLPPLSSGDHLSQSCCRPAPYPPHLPSLHLPSPPCWSPSNLATHLLPPLQGSHSPIPAPVPSPLPWASGVLANSRPAPNYPSFHATRDIYLDQGITQG